MAYDIKGMIEGLKRGLDHSPVTNRTDVSNYVISAESASSENRELLQSTVNSVTDLVKDCIVNCNISTESYTAAQLNAATKIAALSLSPGAALNMVSKLTPGEGAIGPVALGVEDALEFRDITVSQEAYDGQKTDNCFLYSVAYNFVASRQDEFGEAFYPTVVIDPTTSDITMEIKFASLMNEVRHNINGSSSRAQFSKVPLPKAIYDNKIFGTDKNRIIPVLRDENKELLLESEKRLDNTTAEAIETAPYKFNVDINLLGIGQTDSLLARGQMDNTDAVDRTIVLSNVYASIKDDTNDAEIFKLDVSNLSFNSFVYSPQGHNKDMVLNFSKQQVKFDTRETKTSKGAESKILKALPEGYVINVELDIRGEVSTQVGDMTVYGTRAKVFSVRNKAGDLLAPTEADYKAIVKVFDNFKYEGFDLVAYTTNSNLRKRGQLITVDSFKQPFYVPPRSGIMSIVPINNDMGTDNDVDAIIGQAQALGAKISISAVDEIMRNIDSVRFLTNNGTSVPEVEAIEAGFKGIAKYVVNPAYVYETIDLTTTVSSLDSKSRDESVRAALLQKIYNAAVKLYIDSNYGIVFERIINGSSAARPTLIVGTDPNIKRLLLTDVSSSDTIQLGSMFDIKIVSTFNSRMTGKIVFSFGVFDQQRNTNPNPLNYGVCAYAPDIVYDLVRDLNGQTSREKHNNPRYLHITNLPIIGVFDVTNVGEVFGQLALPIVNKA